MRTRKKLLVGYILCTVAAMESISAHGQTHAHFLQRHLSGDWGEALTAEEQESNERSLAEGLAVASAYVLGNGETLWIVTESGWNVTRLLLGREL